ncbi:MAG: AbrB/MazE/SpoVT family DNA-binding domain-containing protein [Candidatus Asgardarchaeum sp.]
MLVISRVGKKGEIVLRKAIREKAGIKPGDYIILSSKKGEITIRKIGSAKEFLEMPKLIKISKEELEKLRRKIHKEMKEDTLNEI